MTIEIRISLTLVSPSFLYTTKIAPPKKIARPPRIHARLESYRAAISRSRELSIRLSYRVTTEESAMAVNLWLIRHGETTWSLSGAHTGRTDLPLTDVGRKKAAAMRRCLADCHFALVLTSPLERARETCRLAGFGDAAQIEPNLR